MGFNDADVYTFPRYLIPCLCSPPALISPLTFSAVCEIFLFFSSERSLFSFRMAVLTACITSIKSCTSAISKSPICFRSSLFILFSIRAFGTKSSPSVLFSASYASPRRLSSSLPITFTPSSLVYPFSRIDIPIPSSSFMALSILSRYSFFFSACRSCACLIFSLTSAFFSSKVTPFSFSLAVSILWARSVTILSAFSFANSSS